MVSVQRHLLNLRSMLQDDESERTWIRAERLETTHVGALMVTDRRLLFSGLGFFAPSLEAVPFAALRRPVEETAGRRGVLRLAVFDEERRYAGKPGDVQRAHAALRTAMADAGVDPDVDAAGGLAAELERLAALHGFGVLTDEEFASAKRTLLARPPAD